jgi:hypothetical protein
MSGATDETPLIRVYLDQRDWVRLARQHYGNGHDEGIAGVLALVLEASSTGRASFPLSAVHYMETLRRGDPASRQRLGRFMAQVSRLHTMASAVDLLDREVAASLRTLAGLPPQPALGAFGRGVAHAFGQRPMPYFQEPDRLARAVARFGQEGLFTIFETAMLTGPGERLPWRGVALPTREYANRQLAFEEETTRSLIEGGHSSDRAHRLVLAQEAQDVLDPVNEQAPALGLDPRSLVASGQALTDFMLSLPAKGAICRMRMTAHENKTFRWHVGDLNDMTALGTAAGYCDVVVAENQWGSILRRHAPHLRAKVISDLKDLPALLVP